MTHPAGRSTVRRITSRMSVATNQTSAGAALTPVSSTLYCLTIPRSTSRSTCLWFWFKTDLKYSIAKVWRWRGGHHRHKQPSWWSVSAQLAWSFLHYSWCVINSKWQDTGQSANARSTQIAPKGRIQTRRRNLNVNIAHLHPSRPHCRFAWPIALSRAQDGTLVRVDMFTLIIIVSGVADTTD